MLASKNPFQRPGNSVVAGNRKPVSERFVGRPTLLAVTIAAALSGAAPMAVDAAGLGRLTVQSALGQPLRAEVEVTALGREEIGSLSARLGSPEAFRQAGLEYNPALSNLRFAIEQQSGGGAIVRVSSTQPVNEPFVDLLLELNWSAGKFVREYTFLLDPPELRMGRDTLVAGGAGATAAAPSVRVASAGASTAATAPAAQPRAAGTGVAAVVPVASSVARSSPVPSPADSADASGTVLVRAGDTLTKIAAQVKPADVTVEQAVMAIYQANPRAFFGTVHQLYAGVELAIPDAATIRAVDAVAARREIRAQAAEFNAYRARLASAARSVQPARAGQSVEGSVAVKPEEAGAPLVGGDQLKLSRSQPAEAIVGGLAAGSADAAEAASAEAQVAQDAALQEQQERVSALERNVVDLQQLVELKNQQLAELQRQVEAARAAAVTASGTIAAASPAAAEPSAAEPAAADGEVRPPDAALAAADTSEAAASGTPPTEPAVAAPVDSIPASSTAEAPSVLESLMNNPLALPALVAIALGIGAFGVYAVRRRRKSGEFEDSLSSADAFTANSLFGSTGGQAVDTHASLFATSGRDSGVDVHSTEVDPIAEAEVYIAYGRETQAEEILKEALKRQPERQAIRLKLLEIHAARKDPVAFGALALEMYDQTGGQNEEWAKVVTLGLAIDPANPLYNGQGESTAPQSVVEANEEAVPGAPLADDEPPAIADLGDEADAAAAMIGEPGFDPALSARRAFGGPFAETVPMDDVEPASVDATADDHAEIPALDFDLDLDTTVGRAGSALAAREDGAGGAESIERREADTPADSDLEQAIEGRFELPSLDLDTSPMSQEGDDVRDVSPAGDDELPALADLGDFKIDLPALEGIDSHTPDTDDELPAVDLADLESRPARHDFGFSSIDLELPDSDAGFESADVAVAAQAESSRWQEMATKLDLASAYEEIGDKEGARELLQEVVDGGDVSQQQKARTMLAKIG